MTHLALSLCLSPSPEILYQGGDTSHAEPRQQHHEDSSNVGDAQRGSLPTLGLFLESVILTFRYEGHGDKALQFPDTFRGLLWVLTASEEISQNSAEISNKAESSELPDWHPNHLALAAASHSLPPFLLEKVELASLLKLQDCVCHRCSVGRV